MDSHWSLNDIKSPQVSKTPLAIQADLINAIDGIFSIRLLISKSSTPFIKIFGDCTRRTNYNSHHCHCHAPYFFQFSSKVQVLIFLFAFFQFYFVFSQNSKVHYLASSLFVVVVVADWQRVGDPFVSQNPCEDLASYSSRRLLYCAYTICWHGQTDFTYDMIDRFIFITT